MIATQIQERIRKMRHDFIVHATENDEGYMFKLAGDLDYLSYAAEALVRERECSR